MHNSLSDNVLWRLPFTADFLEWSALSVTFPTFSTTIHLSTYISLHFHGPHNTVRGHRTAKCTGLSCLRSLGVTLNSWRCLFFVWTCFPAPFSTGSSLPSGFSTSFENVLGFLEGPQQTHAILALAFLHSTLSPVLVQELRTYDPAVLDTARTWKSHMNLNLNMPQSRLFAFPSKWASLSTRSLKSEPGRTSTFPPYIQSIK